MMKDNPEQETAGKTSCCTCPYCDIDLENPIPFCRICGSQLRYCSQCGTPIKKEDTVCPTCGATKVVQE